MRNPEAVQKMEKSLKFLGRVEKTIASARKIKDFGCRYNDRFEVVHAAMVLNPYRLDINALDSYIFSREDTPDTLYTTRTKIITELAQEVDTYRHIGRGQYTSQRLERQTLEGAEGESGTDVKPKKIRRGTVINRRIRENHSTFMSIMRGVNHLKDAEEDYRADILSPLPEAKRTEKEREFEQNVLDFKHNVFIFAVQNRDRYGEDIEKRGVAEAYLNNFDKAAIGRMSQEFSRG